ncbi:MAG: hypothetical protein CO170_03210 [candidate division SR1 bacterium CG_4_9_14_3_um_filter_40_9]|nr:MAG: hypothetical protein CO170_03210 [candidate division SR1 bacterium CG_4_9_14_3_um_filter_40_9]
MQRIPKLQVDGDKLMLHAGEIHKEMNVDNIIHRRSLLIGCITQYNQLNFFIKKETYTIPHISNRILTKYKQT